MDNKYNIGDKVLLEYGGGYGVYSEIIDWRYSPKTGYSYEIKDRPDRYWKEKRILEGDYMEKKKCPECGSENYYPQGSCWICVDCGYSPCK